MINDRSNTLVPVLHSSLLYQTETPLNKIVEAHGNVGNANDLHAVRTESAAGAMCDWFNPT